MDKRIEIHGTSRMNGKRGVATDFHPAFTASGNLDPEQSRYSVHLDSGEAFRVREGNVRAEPRAGAAGGRAAGGTRR